MNNKVSIERLICGVIGSAFIDEIGGENSSLFELSSLPLLFRELHDDWLKKVFERRPVGNSVLAFGHNKFGQLGLGERRNRYKPTIISALNGIKIVQVACGWNHSMALLESGEIRSWGFNFYGQLGLGHNQEMRSIPFEIVVLKGMQVIEISCGIEHSMALNSDGIAYSWGGNECGQLGFGDNVDRNKPDKITSFKDKKISKIFCSYDQSFFVLENNKVFASGRNSAGQLGVGDLKNKNKPQRVISISGIYPISITSGVSHSLLLTDKGDVLICGDKSFDTEAEQDILKAFKIVSELQGKKIISIGCGETHCIALEDNGNLFAWGMNENGQLGFGDTLNRLKPEKVSTLNGKLIEKIYCGRNHNFAITGYNHNFFFFFVFKTISVMDSNEIFGWGGNQFQQLSIEKEKDILTPKSIPSLQSKQILQIACTGAFSLALCCI